MNTAGIIPLESISDCFSKYLDIEGTASRSEFWWFFIFYILVSHVARFLLPSWLAISIQLVLIVPLATAAVRRLHDTERSGWWLVLLPLTILPLYFGQDGGYLDGSPIIGLFMFATVVVHLFIYYWLAAPWDWLTAPKLTSTLESHSMTHTRLGDDVQAQAMGRVLQSLNRQLADNYDQSRQEVFEREYGRAVTLHSMTHTGSDDEMEEKVMDDVFLQMREEFPDITPGDVAECFRLHAQKFQNR